MSKSKEKRPILNHLQKLPFYLGLLGLFLTSPFTNPIEAQNKNPDLKDKNENQKNSYYAYFPWVESGSCKNEKVAAAWSSSNVYDQVKNLLCLSDRYSLSSPDQFRFVFWNDCRGGAESNYAAMPFEGSLGDFECPDGTFINYYEKFEELAQQISENDDVIVFVFNETNLSAQANRTPEQMNIIYQNLRAIARQYNVENKITWVGPNIVFGINDQIAFSDMKQFFILCQTGLGANCGFDVLGIHHYGLGSPDLTAMNQIIIDELASININIARTWITEFGMSACPGSANEQALATEFYRRTTQLLNDPNIEKIWVFGVMNYDSIYGECYYLALPKADGSGYYLTALGDAFRAAVLGQPRPLTVLDSADFFMPQDYLPSQAYP